MKKRRWIALLLVMAVLAMMLVNSGVAMADIQYEGEVPQCETCILPMQQQGSAISQGEYHTIRWKCATCFATQSVDYYHSMSRPNCVSGAHCTVCGKPSEGEDSKPDDTNHAGLWVSYVSLGPESHAVQGGCSACDDFIEGEEEHTFGPWQSSEDGKQHIRRCVCGETQSGDHIGGSPTCKTAATCTVCNLPYYGDHSCEVEATCVSGAICGVCKQAYGDINPDNHSWGAWHPGTINPSLHVRVCQNSGCYKAQSAPHTGDANCVTEVRCEDCNIKYKNPNKHAGPFTYSYKKEDDEFHKEVKICTACEKETGDFVSIKHEEKNPANCTRAAVCKVCLQEYGSLNPDKHDWGAWTPDTGNKTHTSVCKNNSDHKQTEKHTGGGATCSTFGDCSVCNVHYKNSDVHEGTATTTYTKTSDIEHTPTTTYSGCPHSVTGDSEAHTQTSAATCTTAAYCADCDSNYGSTNPDNHVGGTTTTYTKKDDSKHTVAVICKGCTNAVRETTEDHRVGTEATCTQAAVCADCDSSYGEPDPTAHDLVSHGARAASCTQKGWYAYQTCRRCDYTTYVEIAALGHDVVTHEAQAASCTEKGWAAYETCARCDYSTYAEIAALGHDMVLHNPKAASCTEGGWDVYETCARCDHCVYVPTAALGHDYAAKVVKPGCTEQGYTVHTCSRCQDSYRDAYVAALGHWYGEWTPCGDGTNSAVCLRGDGQERAVDCARYGFALTAGEARLELTLCPVCGEVCEIRLLDENGEVLEALSDARLALAEGAAAEALTGYLPTGELVVRMGALEGGEMLMSVAFEASGEATLPTGQVKITLPAALLEGYALALIDGDGAEAALPVEADEAAETVSFVLDFTETETPVRLIRLVAEA